MAVEVLGKILSQLLIMYQVFPLYLKDVCGQLIYEITQVTDVHQLE